MLFGYRYPETLHILILVIYCEILLLANITNGQNNKYVILLEPTNWYQALINCKKGEMELASIHSEQEQVELENFMRINKYEKAFWMGATREGDGKQFYWTSTGSKMIYTKWLVNQPDNSSSDLNFYEGENCVGWGLTDYTPDPIGWNDFSCLLKLPAICQKIEYCSLELNNKNNNNALS